MKMQVERRGTMWARPRQTAVNKLFKWAARKALKAGSNYVRKNGPRWVKNTTRNFMSPATPTGRPIAMPFGNKSYQSTPGGTLVAKRKTGMSNATSAGFIKSRRYRPSKRVKKAVNGIVITEEFGKEGTFSGQCAWLGHNSCPTVVMWENMWRLLVKKVFTKNGMVIKQYTESISNITAGDVVTVHYQITDAVATQLIHTVVAGDTLDSIAATYYNSGLLRAADVTMKTISYIPTVNAAGSNQDRAPSRVDLESAFIDMYHKSSMKVQNRTVNDAGDNLESLDVVPLYGKTYGGKGNGPLQNSAYSSGIVKQLIADRDSGYIEGTASDIGQAEPINSIYFPGAKQQGKLKIEPAHIKTSVLTYNRHIGVNYLRKLLGDALSQSKIRSPLGNFRFFALERIIQTSLTPTSITLGIEINHYMSMSLKVKHRDVTVPIFVYNVLP